MVCAPHEEVEKLQTAGICGVFWGRAGSRKKGHICGHKVKREVVKMRSSMMIQRIISVSDKFSLSPLQWTKDYLKYECWFKCQISFILNAIILSSGWVNG